MLDSDDASAIVPASGMRSRTDRRCLVTADGKLQGRAVDGYMYGMQSITISSEWTCVSLLSHSSGEKPKPSSQHILCVESALGVAKGFGRFNAVVVGPKRVGGGRGGAEATKRGT